MGSGIPSPRLVAGPLILLLVMRVGVARGEPLHARIDRTIEAKLDRDPRPRRRTPNS